MTNLEWLSRLLMDWPEDEPEHHLIRAQVFFILAAKAQEKARRLQGRVT